MIATLNRGPITDHLITVLAGLTLPIGDNNIPTVSYGWQGEPNADGSTFIPWLSIAGGVTQPGTGPMGASAADWRAPYTVNYAGVSRSQVDWIADRARNLLVDISRETVSTPQGDWKIQQIRCTTLGASLRVGSPFPDYFTQADLFEVWLSKEL